MKKFEDLVKEARNKILEIKDVEKAELYDKFIESKPGTQQEIYFNVFHKLNDGYVWSKVICYIDIPNEKFYLHYGVGNLLKSEFTFKELVESKFDEIKETLKFEFIYFKSIDEQQKYAFLYGIKASGDNICYQDEFIVYLVGEELKYKVL